MRWVKKNGPTSISAPDPALAMSVHPTHFDLATPLSGDGPHRSGDSPLLPRIVHFTVGFGPRLYTVSCYHPSPRRDRHLDQFSRFGTVHGHVQLIPRNIDNNRPRLFTPCVRCGLIIIHVQVADPGGVQGVQTPALLFMCFFLKNIF